MTLSYETRLIAALHALKLPGSADRVAAAPSSRHEREALFHVERAELLQQEHARTAFSALLTDSLATVAATADGRALLLLPLDWVRWTTAADSTVREIATLGGELSSMVPPQVAQALRKRYQELGDSHMPPTSLRDEAARIMQFFNVSE